MVSLRPRNVASRKAAYNLRHTLNVNTHGVFVVICSEKQMGLWLPLAVGCVLLSLLLIGRSTPESSANQSQTITWQPVFQGVDYAAWSTKQPRPLSWHAVRIDVRQPGVRFLVTPSNGEKPMDVDSMTTSSFLKRQNCQVAINGSPFAPLRSGEGEPQDVLGVSISSGDSYSPPERDYGGLLIGKDNKAHIVAAPVGSETLHGVDQAISGFYPLMLEGKIVVDENDIPAKRHPRTAVGVSQDRKYIYLVVVDGRQTGFSEGVTLLELAQQMRALAAYEALNLDGGGSTTLVLEGDDKKPMVKNRPIHRGEPGTERAVANHLGVYAERLESE